MAGVTLGHDVETDVPVVLDDDARLRGLYIIGINGTGKTTLIESLALEDMKAGHGLCVLDPHGDLVERLLEQIPPERAQDVVLLDPRDADYPFGLNPYDCEEHDHPQTVGRVAAQIVELFQKLWGEGGSEGTSWGPRVAQFMRNTAFTLLEHGDLTMAEIPALLSDAGFRQRVLAKVTNPQVRTFWANYESLKTPERRLERAESTLNKLDEFLTQPVVANIVGQTKTKADFRKFMDEGRIVLVPLGLGTLGEPVVNLLGSLVTLQILNAALSRQEIPQTGRRQFCIYADEYQRFGTPAFATLLTEARKYGVATTIAHQVRSQLDLRNRDAALNAGNIVVFAVHGADAEEMAKQFDRTPPEPAVAGERPMRTPSLDPVAHLVRNGHANEDVRRHVARHLAPLIEKLGALDREESANFTLRPEDPRLGHHTKPPNVYLNPDFFSDAGVYRTAPASLQEGRTLLSAYLRDAMERRIDPRTEEAMGRLGTIALWLRGILGIAPDAQGYWTGGGPLSIIPTRWRWEHTNVPLQTQKAMARLAGAISSQFLGRASAFGTVADCFDKLVAARVEAVHPKSYLGADTARLEAVGLRASLEAKHYAEFMLDVTEIALHLREKPILVESGQYIAVMDHPRTYSDMEGEVANRLVNQPQFHATCKIVAAGTPKAYRLRTPSFMDLANKLVIQDESHVSPEWHTIRERSRELYCRRRVEVESEMRSRVSGNNVTARFLRQ